MKGFVVFISVSSSLKPPAKPTKPERYALRAPLLSSCTGGSTYSVWLRAFGPHDGEECGGDSDNSVEELWPSKLLWKICIFGWSGSKCSSSIILLEFTTSWAANCQPPGRSRLPLPTIPLTSPSRSSQELSYASPADYTYIDTSKAYFQLTCAISYWHHKILVTNFDKGC